MTLPISVVIPAYNRADLLPRALASVSAQQPAPPAEVIVVDDGSEDGTADVAESLGARVIRLHPNQGQASARDAGVEAAREPWVAFLDSDDRWLPHHLATVWALRGDHHLVGASSLHCRPDPSRNRVVGPLTHAPRVIATPRELLHPHNYLTTSTTLARRDALRADGGFRAHGGVVEDLDMWLRVLEGGTAVVSPEVTTIYHVEGERISDDVPRTRAGHTSVAMAYRDREWWSADLVKRWEGASAWDEIREALDGGHRLTAARRALWLVMRPARLRGAIDLLAWRFRARRATGRVTPDGTPSRASLIGPGNLVRTAPRLIRRPSGIALVNSRTGSWVARALGVTPVDVRHEARPG
jgi:GT2 family glycosyltransferase